MTTRDEIQSLCRRIAACGTDYARSDVLTLTNLLLLESNWTGQPDEHLLTLGWKWESVGIHWRLIPTTEEVADTPLIVEVHQ